VTALSPVNLVDFAAAALVVPGDCDCAVAV
jgi:hypothetical protein